MKFAPVLRISLLAVFILALIFSTSGVLAANRAAKITIEVTYFDNYQPIRSLDPSDVSDKIFVGNSEAYVGKGIVTIPLTTSSGVPLADPNSDTDVPGLHVERGRDSTGQYVEFTSFGMHIIEEQRESIKFKIKLIDATIDEAVNGPSTKTYENAQDGTCGITEGGGAIDDDSDNDEYSVVEGGTTGTFCSVVSGKIDQVRIYYDVIPIPPVIPPVVNNTNQTHPGNETNHTIPGNNTNQTIPGNNTNQTGGNHTNTDVTPPVITNVNVTPSLPFTFNLTIPGLETCQNFQITFTSNEYPLNVTVNLFKDGDGLIDSMKYPPLNNSGDLPIVYATPMDLRVGSYTLNLTAADKSGNAVTITLGKIFVINGTAIPGNNTNQTNPGNNQTNNTNPGNNNNNNGGRTTRKTTNIISLADEQPTAKASPVLDEEESIVLNTPKLVSKPSSGLVWLFVLVGLNVILVIVLLVLASQRL
ncbi:hypothetical protein KW787_01795 [Candidatus Pacearchaeota archaeon]|nr:hypothetical protein [Candidatus Pacearchaeota archaeon]